MHCPHTKQCIAVNKSLRHQEIRNSKSKIRNPKISWERQESNPGRLGEKRERYLCAMPTPSMTTIGPLDTLQGSLLAGQGKKRDQKTSV